MAYFQTKNPNLGNFWEGGCLELKFVGIFYGHLLYFVAICHFCGHLILWLFGIFSRFGMLYQEKSGNRVSKTE
jgi:hypothetical protein